MGALTGGVINGSGGKILPGQSGALETVLSPNLADFLNNDRSYDNARPKAYLNWVLFDNQFNFVAGSSGVVQVLAGSSKQALVAPLQTIAKNGYLYVYVSNESPQNVYFDDVTVTHYTGPLLQEQAYYPYGLQMQGLSDKAMLKTGNPYKYNAGSELEDEDGLEYYNTFFRKYDAQIGRFTGVDILAEATYGFTPFQFGGNNPAMFNDPSGALFAGAAGRPQKGPDGNYHAGWVSNMLWNDKGFYSMEDLGYEYSGGGGNYFHYTGISSQNVLDQLRFGESFNGFTTNKSGEYGFWSDFDVDSKIRGDGKVNLAGVAVGRRWVSFDETKVWAIVWESSKGDVGHAALRVGDYVFGYYPTDRNGDNAYGKDDLGSSPGKMHINSMAEFNEGYKGNKVTYYQLQLNNSQVNSLLQALSSFTINPGQYSLAGFTCSSVAVLSLNYAGIVLKERNGDNLQALGTSPDHFGSVLSLSINSNIVTRSRSFIVGQ